MSFTRDKDRRTRGPGAIAAIDGVSNHLRALKQRQALAMARRDAQMARLSRGAFTSRGSLGAISLETDRPVPRGGGRVITQGGQLPQTQTPLPQKAPVPMSVPTTPAPGTPPPIPGDPIPGPRPYPSIPGGGIPAPPPPPPVTVPDIPIPPYPSQPPPAPPPSGGGGGTWNDPTVGIPGPNWTPTTPDLEPVPDIDVSESSTGIDTKYLIWGGVALAAWLMIRNSHED